jgi:hypothetical protein
MDEVWIQISPDSSLHSNHVVARLLKLSSGMNSIYFVTESVLETTGIGKKAQQYADGHVDGTRLSTVRGTETYAA